MVAGIIGRKIGMTQVFGDDGVVSPATVLQAGPCVVVQRKTVDRDGYDAAQIGLVEPRPARVSKAVAGHYRRADVPPTRVRREVGVGAGGETPQEGEQVTRHGSPAQWCDSGVYPKNTKPDHRDPCFG